MSNEERQVLRDQDIAAMRACVQHAKALLASAEVVHAKGHSNIAFHLGVLALEELGRRELIGLQLAADESPAGRTWQKHALAHTKKIFWCFFGMELFSGTLIKERLDGLTAFAEDLHAQRMAGLYVNYEEEELHIPADAITTEQCARLLTLATAQLRMVEAQKFRDTLSQDDVDLQLWFHRLADQPHNKKLIFSGTSLTKLSELKDARAWMVWLKEQVALIDAQTRKNIEEELERSRHLPENLGKDKWKLRLRIMSQSHSVRQLPLNKWNEKSDWIKLFAVSGKPNQLIVELTFAENVPLGGLWGFGWGLARHFVAALNLATFGFWWWRMPVDIDSFYEDLEDLETHAKLGLRRTPSLRIDWGRKRVLSDEELGRVAAALISLPGPANADDHKPYDYYIGGLTFLSLNDVHWQCEVQAFGNFFESAKAMMEQVGAWRANTPFAPVLDAFLREMMPEMDDHELFRRLFDAFEKQDPSTATVTLREVALMKVFCDVYFAKHVIPQAVARRRAKKDESTTEPEETGL